MRGSTFGAVEGPVIRDPTSDLGIDFPGEVGRSVPLRRLRCQSLICLPFAFFAPVLMAGRNSRRVLVGRSLGVPERYSQENRSWSASTLPGGGRPCRRRPWSSPHELEPQGPQPLGQSGPQSSGLRLGVAMDYFIIRVALEGAVRVFPDHPSVERVVHEEVGEQR